MLLMIYEMYSFIDLRKFQLVVVYSHMRINIGRTLLDRLRVAYLT